MNEHICPLTGKPCGKPKVFHITDVVGKEVHQLHLCQECGPAFVEGGSKPEKLEEILEKKTELPPSDQLQSLMEFFNFVTKGPKKGVMPLPEDFVSPSSKKKTIHPLAQKACPNCKITLQEIADSGRLGCLHCYDFFGQELKGVLLNTHGSLKHVGKVPKNWKKKQEDEKNKSLADGIENMKNAVENDNKKLSPDKHIRWLEKKMNTCSKKENYEESAVIRDVINKLQPMAIRYDALTRKMKEIIEKEEYEIAVTLKAEIASIKEVAGDIVTAYEKPRLDRNKPRSDS